MTIAPAPIATRKSPPTSGARDLSIDFVRALCVVGVVTLHAMMVGITMTDSGPVFDNASVGTWWIIPLSWALQVMPLFFVIGGFSGFLAYRKAGDRGAVTFAVARLQRLLRPAVVVIAAAGLALSVLTLVGVPEHLLETAGFRYGQPLWFLAVFLGCQALLPALATAHRRAPRTAIALLATAAICVDVVSRVTGVSEFGFLNLGFVWLTMQQLGFFLADGTIDALSRRTRAAWGGASAAALVILVAAGVYSPDLIANINPPTAALFLVGLAHTSVFSLQRERIARFSRVPAASAFTAFVTARAMTIYLWHMPVLLTMAGATALIAGVGGIKLPNPDSAQWWAQRPLWLVTALVLTALVAATRLSRIESTHGSTSALSARRAAAATITGIGAIALLLACGTAVATASIAVVLLLASLRLVGEKPGHAIPRAASASPTSSA